MRNARHDRRMTIDANSKRAQLALVGSALAGLVLGVAVLIGSVSRKPGLEGWLTGIFGGTLLALVITAAGAWAAISLMRPREPTTLDAELAPNDPLRGKAAGVLDELEAVRKETVAKINKRAYWRVPLCTAGGVALWSYNLSRGEEFDFMDGIAMTVIPAFAGYFWASAKLGSAYGKLYKERVLPALAAEFGEMAWRPAGGFDTDALKTERIFRDFDYVTADDQLHGTHRGLPTQITELKLEKKSGDNDTTIFDGLIVEMTLPKHLTGVTAVIPDGGAIGNFRDRMLGKGSQRVGLEDPVFEKVYEVYGSDQVEARTLLHPAFMQRMLELGQRTDYGRPLMLARDNHILIALPKTNGRNLFEAPSFTKPAASREALQRLRADIAALLAAADAVIALENPHRARQP